MADQDEWWTTIYGGRRSLVGQHTACIIIMCVDFPISGITRSPKNMELTMKKEYNLVFFTQKVDNGHST